MTAPRILLFSFLIIAATGCQNAPVKNESSKSRDMSGLAAAEGRVADDFTKEKLEALLDENRLTVFHVNEMTDRMSFETVERLVQKYDLEIHPIHLIVGRASSRDSVNLFIRKNNFVSDAFIMENREFLKKELPHWTGKLPMFWIVNREEGVELFYEQRLTEEELISILQPVTL